MFRIFVWSCLLLVGLLAPNLAHAESIVRYQLALAGYELGMSYEDAVVVRPFVSVAAATQELYGGETVVGRVDQVYVNDVEFSFRVTFVDNRLERLVGQFSPLETERIRKALTAALGPGRSREKTVTTTAGVQNRMVHDHWEFPTARLDLIAIDTNTEYATLAMRSQHRELRAGEGPAAAEDAEPAAAGD